MADLPPEDDVVLVALAVCVKALRPMRRRVREAALAYLADRLLRHPPVEDGPVPEDAPPELLAASVTP